MTKILHLTEAGGGVLEVIKNIAEIDKKNQHILLARKRDFSSNSLDKSMASLEVVFWRGNLLKAYLKFLKLNRESHIDIVHFHSSRAGVLRVLFRGIKRVYSPHCFAFERLDINLLARKFYYAIERLLLHFTDGFLAVNKFELEWVTHTQLQIATSRYEYVAERKLRKETEQSLIGIGRICIQKNPDRFINIVNALRHETSNLKVIWIGEGDQELTNKLRENNIIVTGWLDSERVNAILRSGSMLLHTAKWEGMPVVFFEAWSIGLPIYALAANYLEGIARVNIFNSDTDAVNQILEELTKRRLNSVYVVDKKRAVSRLNEFYSRVLVNSKVTVSG